MTIKHKIIRDGSKRADTNLLTMDCIGRTMARPPRMMGTRAILLLTRTPSKAHVGLSSCATNRKPSVKKEEWHETRRALVAYRLRLQGQATHRLVADELRHLLNIVTVTAKGNTAGS